MIGGNAQAVRFSLRFENVVVDPESVVLDAYIALIDDSTPRNYPWRFPLGNDISIRITAEAAADSLPFGTDNPGLFTSDQKGKIRAAESNIGDFDLSRRVHTQAEVRTNDLPESIPDAVWDTPDLSTIVQEVIRIPGWRRGNAVAFSFMPTNTNASKICELPVNVRSFADAKDRTKLQISSKSPRHDQTNGWTDKQADRQIHEWIDR